MIRRGICFHVINPIEFPATPGSDVVGNIIKVGKKVRQYRVGDRVAALVRTGGNARYINVSEVDLIQVPRSCDSAEAVCMVSTFMTAYQALRLVTKDKFTLSGKRVLITGGIEPVGQALIQLCKRAGSEDVYATAPMHRHRYIKSVLGAHPLPVHPKDWLPTTKGGMDIVFDGTCHDSLDSPYASLKNEGVLVSVGMSVLLTRAQPSLLGAPVSAYWARFKAQFFSNIKSYEVWESFNDNKDAFKLDLEILFHLLKKKFIKPHIAKKIALSEVPEAQASLEQENARGEIVCLPWKRDTKR
jgi:NADPH:quinone reductase-like Zn-dependent oxidoreductase